MTRILITGASGFLGSALACRLSIEGRPLRVALRHPQPHWPAEVEVVPVSGLEPDADWSMAVEGIETIVHCAARVHIMREEELTPLDEFRKINVYGTINLARQAIEAGVKRFVLISSIGVNGAETTDRAFSADDVVSPQTPYAISKWEVEQELMKLAKTSGLEVVIIRPPLIYGQGAPGNFAQLLRAVKLRLPLPFGRLQNLRSFVALDNVVDLINRCIDHPRAANQIFLVSDGEDLSTAEFIQRIAKALGKPILLFPISEKWLNKLAGLFGKQQQLRKITGSLQINIEKTMTMLSWKPVISIDDALNSAVLSRRARPGNTLDVKSNR
jgi:nucleoside-diphosphate-sugar epimerase